MKRPNADEISRWLMDDTLVSQAKIDDMWVEVSSPVNWAVVRTSIATVEDKTLFDGDTYYNANGDKCVVRPATLSNFMSKQDWDNCTLTPPKPKSILDSDEFYTIVSNLANFGGQIEPLKQFIRHHKGEI